MFTKPKPETELDRAIDSNYALLKMHQPDTEEYVKISDQIVKLTKLRADTAAPTVSPDTLALIAANLFGIVMIIRHEHANVITSKALSFVLKNR